MTIFSFRSLAEAQMRVEEAERRINILNNNTVDNSWYSYLYRSKPTEQVHYQFRLDI